MTGKSVYFISDLHLGATYLNKPLDYEKRVVNWLRSISDDVGQLYLLGDILDYWYEYRTVVPRGYVRFFGALAELADKGVKITWFIGNHDIWLFDYLRDEIGIEIIDGYIERDILGKRFFLSHGDGLGKLKPSFKLIRYIFRNKFCQKLYSAIHPRWTIPFAHRWSTSSRNFSEEIPQLGNPEEESLIIFSKEYLLTHPDIDYFIYGHKHVVVDYIIAPERHVIILGDWIHHFSFAHFDGESLKMFKYLNGQIKKLDF
ncbi:MAG: UDP-2,3-diacylglucosamine diphosphatase [Muribaculum sp.]|nr:UDP-2,3-diacylglucosamine diphosphatase [Muribaculum sp.]